MKIYKKYTLKYSKSISKFLKKVDCSIYIQILKKLKELEINAYLGKPLKSNYKNFRSLHINKFRVIYKIEKNIIFILKIGYRKDIYNQKINRDNFYLNENKKRIVSIIGKLGYYYS
jgi:addiction module RelE/StbE family toxin